MFEIPGEHFCRKIRKIPETFSMFHATPIREQILHQTGVFGRAAELGAAYGGHVVIVDAGAPFRPNPHKTRDRTHAQIQTFFL